MFLFRAEPVTDNANIAATAAVVENENVKEAQQQAMRELQLDGGFVVPGSNAFGQNFRFNMLKF